MLGVSVARGSESGESGELAEMPGRLALRLDVVGDEVVVSYGGGCWPATSVAIGGCATWRSCP